MCTRVAMRECIKICDGCGRQVECDRQSAPAFCNHCSDRALLQDNKKILMHLTDPFVDAFALLLLLHRPKKLIDDFLSKNRSTVDVLKFYCFAYAAASLVNFIFQNEISFPDIFNIIFNASAFTVMEAPLVGDFFIILMGYCFSSFSAMLIHLAMLRFSRFDLLILMVKINFLYSGLNIFIFSLAQGATKGQPEILSSIITYVFLLPYFLILVIACSCLYYRNVFSTFFSVTISATLIQSILS